VQDKSSDRYAEMKHAEKIAEEALYWKNPDDQAFSDTVGIA